ncbi:MAG: hypothetical protein ABW003_09715, partial [Microvirga sp.]
MPDPLTVGALVASLVVKIAESGFGELAKETAKDAYKNLKEKISQSAGSKVALLEAAPDSVRTRN